MKEKRIVHLINEAKQQGAVLTLADLSAIMLVNRSTLSVRTKKNIKKILGRCSPLLAIRWILGLASHINAMW